MKGFRSEWRWADSGKRDRMDRFLDEPANWRDGLNKEKYLASAELQDRAFKINSDAAFRRAVKSGVLEEADSPERIAGFLKARHISGYGGAKAVVVGGHRIEDSNGTSNYDYYNDIAINRDGLDRYMALTRTHYSAIARAQGQDAVHCIQENLNKLGITDAERRPLVVDGNRGGPKSNTNEAIAAFQEQFGLTGELSNAQLLMATQVALSADPVRNFDRAMGKVLQPGRESSPSSMVDGMPDYLRLPDEYRQTAHAPRPPQHAAPTPTPHRSAPTPTPLVSHDLDDVTVKALQRDLNQLGMRGINGQPLAVDGDYGKHTRHAVAAFQREQGLPATGLTDSKTLGAVNAYVIVADLQRHKAKREAPDQFQAGVQPYARSPDEVFGHGESARLDPLGRETATLHAMHHPGVSGMGALRETYGPPITPQATTLSDVASPPLRRAADTFDHTVLGQRPMTWHQPVAAEPSVALRPFCDARHPQHGLYEDVRERLAAKDQHFPEDRLSQITAALHNANFKAGWEGRIDVKDDKVYAQNYESYTQPGVIVPLDKPAPSTQASMEDVQRQDQIKVEQHEAFVQQQQQARAQGPQGPVIR